MAGKHVRYILMAENMLESYIIQLPHSLVYVHYN